MPPMSWMPFMVLQPRDDADRPRLCRDARARPARPSSDGAVSCWRLELPQRHADVGARKALVRHRDGGRVRAGGDGVRHLLLQRDECRIAVACAGSPGTHRGARGRTAGRVPCHPWRDAPDRHARTAPGRPGSARSRHGCGGGAAGRAAHGCADRPGSCRRAAGSAGTPRCGRAGSGTRDADWSRG